MTIQSAELASFFKADLERNDPDIFRAIGLELGRQRDQIELIASENIVSPAVMAAQGSVLTNKYAEGYPGRRYYGGCEYVDIVEELAIERAKELFGCGFANVQPNSGSQANQGAFMALIKPGDTILGLSLAAGGHLTHGAAPNQSGKWFNAVHYGVSKDTHQIDFDEVRALAREHQPKMIIAGGSAYPRHIDFATFREIADEVGAFLMVDMAHFAGLVAAGVHPSPFPHAHIVTTTTHKTLRGPRGGMILTNDEAIAKKVNSENAAILAKTLVGHGFDIVSGGTDTHVMLVDLRPKKLTGNIAEHALENANITCNKNGIPFDPEKPMVTSGVRLGTPAATTRGFGTAEFTKVGDLIAEVLDGLAANPEDNAAVEEKVRKEVKALCDAFPLYPDL